MYKKVLEDYKLSQESTEMSIRVEARKTVWGKLKSVFEASDETVMDLWAADLRNADLRGSNLSNADLRGADLRNTDLRGADLIYVDLSYSDLRNTDLHGADLRAAYLGYANLRNADLRGSNLRDAILHDADLRNTDLRGAVLRDAILHDANLRDADLRGAEHELFTPEFVQAMQSTIIESDFEHSIALYGDGTLRIGCTVFDTPEAAYKVWQEDWSDRFSQSKADAVMTKISEILGRK